jgi:hypothetical protein
LADEFKEKSDSSSGKNLILLLSFEEKEEDKIRI